MSTDGKPNYKHTLRLPKTDFPMRAGLVKSEPERLAKWDASKLYERIQQNREGAPSFILHDGPPFANGDVHMGTALNKVLKDLVVKSKTMAGIRGAVCARLGLPRPADRVQGRQRFRGLEAGRDPPALRGVRARSTSTSSGRSFRRLGVLGDWEHPYLTLDPGYEAEILRVFAKLVEKDLVYSEQEAGAVELRRTHRAGRGGGRIRGQGYRRST